MSEAARNLDAVKRLVGEILAHERALDELNRKLEKLFGYPTSPPAPPSTVETKSGRVRRVALSLVKGGKSFRLVDASRVAHTSVETVYQGIQPLLTSGTLKRVKRGTYAAK